MNKQGKHQTCKMSRSLQHWLISFSFISQRVKLTTKIHDEYDGVRKLPDALIKQQNEAKKHATRRAAGPAALAKKTTMEEATEDADTEMADSSVQQLINSIPEKPDT
jgi:pleiotropic regulator 1